MVFKELFNEYITSKERIELKTSSISTYLKIYEAQLKDYFENIDVKDFNNSLISQFILKLFDKGLERRYIKSIVNLLYSIINYAKSEYRNYTELTYIKRPTIKSNKKKIELFNDKEQNKIEKYILLNKGSVNVGFLLCLYTGIRIGELCALKVGNFDIKEKTVKINYTLQRIKNSNPNGKSKTEIIIDIPKSESSIRVLPLPDFIIPLLKKLLKNIDDRAFFLTLSPNRFIEPRLLEYKFDRFLKDINIKHKKFHTLRHTFANNMLDLGVDIKSLSEWLGHSNVTITMNEYIHPSFEKKIKQANLLNNKFLKNHQYCIFSVNLIFTESFTPLDLV